MVLKASAGSGKTYALSQRFLQLVISEKIPKNHLRNVLAITFSNNAAKEMRERVIKFLKNLYFQDPKMTDEFMSLVSLSREQLPKKAETLIDEILSNYSDFQVKTIDSFIASIFKASAIDFGYNPEFEIVMNSDYFMDYSFELFLKEVKDGSKEADILDKVINIIHDQKKTDSSFLWDPASKILEELKEIYLKITMTNKTPTIKDHTNEIEEICKKIKAKIEEINKEIISTGLEISGNSSFKRVLEITSKERFADLIGVGLNNPPVKKPDKKSGKDLEYENICNMWSEAATLIKDYINLYSRSYYMPYLRVYEEFKDIIETIKRSQDRVFIGDINYYLASYLDSEIVPDIYFRIGEKIYHFLIDEFQDTSPIQWKNLYPLISNSLSQEGSLFVVGDTKQAIYGFRDADYRIMKRCELENVFSSAKHRVSE
ncbi:MAG: UvrD-helicase domain-containing protein, partial [Thermodesulfovibrionales bacterium]|nr:UvrD-helicase domain-containing protein [Thermodesulfovibrionales bacterium]